MHNIHCAFAYYIQSLLYSKFSVSIQIYSKRNKLGSLKLGIGDTISGITPNYELNDQEHGTVHGCSNDVHV